jgi:glycosyltransferase involved in cell wall biosynthesis
MTGSLIKKKLQKIYQPVLINHFLEKKIQTHKKTRLILSGRFIESKGQFEAIKAFETLITIDNRFELYLVGADDSLFTKRVIKYVEDNKIENIYIVNFVEDLSDYYQKADIALVCSATETFGRITIEAMKFGLPVIVSDIGGNNELVIDGFNGYRYKKGDINDLIDKILLFNNIDTLNKLSENAKEFARRNFALEKYASDLKMIFDKI